MIDFVTGANGFIGKHLMQKIGAGALTVGHEEIYTIAFPNVDRFFFLSTYGNMVGQTDIFETLKANVGDLCYVIGSYVEESKCEHFTYVSSSSVTLPVQTPYSHAKRAGEEIVQASGVRAAIIRPFSVTGVGEQGNHLIPTLIRSCMEGEFMQLVPDVFHDFIDVSDVVDGMLCVAAKKAIGVFELGSSMSFSNGQVKGIVEAACGKRAQARNVESLRDYDTREDWLWMCKDSRARDLGWSPKKTLQQSIEEMVAAYKFRRKHV